MGQKKIKICFSIFLICNENYLFHVCNRMCVDQTADANRQLRSIQLEMENLQRQLQTVSYDRDNAIQENRRTQDDLAAVTSEVRNLQRELETSRGESFDLKRQLQTYVSEVRRAEELLNRKVILLKLYCHYIYNIFKKFQHFFLLFLFHRRMKDQKC